MLATQRRAAPLYVFDGGAVVRPQTFLFIYFLSTTYKRARIETGSTDNGGKLAHVLPWSAVFAHPRWYPLSASQSREIKGWTSCDVPEWKSFCLDRVIKSQWFKAAIVMRWLTETGSSERESGYCLFSWSGSKTVILRLFCQSKVECGLGEDGRNGLFSKRERFFPPQISTKQETLCVLKCMNFGIVVTPLSDGVLRALSLHGLLIFFKWLTQAFKTFLISIC